MKGRKVWKYPFSSSALWGERLTRDCVEPVAVHPLPQTPGPMGIYLQGSRSGPAHFPGGLVKNPFTASEL